MTAPLADVMITLGARDLPELRAFYRRVGWPQLIEDDDFAAFEVHGVVLALFPVAKLARDGRTVPDPGAGGVRFTAGIMVDSPADVDELTERMRAAGARVTKEPVDAEFFPGRSAYLCDPEDNYFEITWSEPTNPITSRRATAAHPGGRPDVAAPVACSLDAGDHAGRVQQWRDVLAGVAPQRTPGGVRALLAVERLPALAGLIAEEARCCPFLSFTLTVTHAGVQLDADAPDEARPILDELFAC